jgi:hypothetical protein
LREKLARTERVAAAFIAADEAVAAAERKREEAVERLNADIRLARVERTKALAALAVTIGSAAEAAAVAGVSEREVREARKQVSDDDAAHAADGFTRARGGVAAAEPQS